LTGLGPGAPGAQEIRQGEAVVPDPRLDRLSGIYRPRRHTPARVDLSLPKFPGEPSESLKASLEKARDADCLLIVVRGFPDALGADPDPDAEAAAMDSELKLADYLVVSKRLERLAEERKRGKAPDPEEVRLLEAAVAALEAGAALRGLPEVALAPKLRGYGLLSAKPALILVNRPDEARDEPDAGPGAGPDGGPGAAPGAAPGGGTGAPDPPPRLGLRGRLEEEFSRLPAEDAAELMGEYGLAELAAARVVRGLYDLNRLISFFTVGEDECRAWTVSRGDTALAAAGKIHSDIQKGFIRAEVVAYDDLMACSGKMAEAKKRGLVRLEGKTYPMADGDVVLFRFNV
jgi:ribosome-binding ATPase YchF (GTP1/OBG family)